MALTDTTLRGLKATGKVQKIADGGGLYIHVTATGKKLWRMAYRFDNKQKTLSFGQYDFISLKDARMQRNEAKELLAIGIDPGVYKKALKEARRAKTEDSFEVIAREWHTKQKNKLTPGTATDCSPAWKTISCQFLAACQLPT